MNKPKSLDRLFAGRHFDRDVIILCVRWYPRYKLSLRALVEMMAERGLSHARTIHCRMGRHRPVVDGLTSLKQASQIQVALQMCECVRREIRQIRRNVWMISLPTMYRAV